MKVVVMAGPESSGKSWLAGELAAHFGAVLVGEYVRYFIDHFHIDPTLAHIPEIATGQLAWEDDARRQQPTLLILDTNLLTNKLWSLTLFGAAPSWLDRELLARHYDLYLLLSPEDVGWAEDGQRCQPELADRQAFFQASGDWLTQHHQPLQVIGGDWQARRAEAFAAVEQLLVS